MEPIIYCTIDPKCASCDTHIGRMPIDIYRAAIKLRGKYLLCPDCRRHKCDICGWIKPLEPIRAIKDKEGNFLGNGCEMCLTWYNEEDLDRDHFFFFLTNAKPNVRAIRDRYLIRDEATLAEYGDGSIGL